MTYISDHILNFALIYSQENEKALELDECEVVIQNTSVIVILGKSLRLSFSATGIISYGDGKGKGKVYVDISKVTFKELKQYTDLTVYGVNYD